MNLEKFCGAMLGVAVGDAVGRPFEGSDPVPREEVERKTEELPLLTYTDDTQMTVALARSLVERRGFDPSDVVKKFLDSYDPSRGYGLTTTLVLQRIKSGESWERASQEVMDGQGSYGNGAAMRVAPIGLLYLHNVEKIKEIAGAASRLTHSHPLGIDGAVLQAVGVGFLAKADVKDFNAESLLKALEAVGSEIYLQKLGKVEELLGKDAGADQVREELGCGSEAFNSVVTALYCFLKTPDDFKGVVLNSVSLGGDTDSIASMAGGLAGAFLGERALPEGWIDKLEEKENIRSLAKDLFLLHVEEVLGKRCEMCMGEDDARPYKVDPEGEDEVSNFILLCNRCKLESEQEKEDFLAKPRKHGKYRAVYRKAHRRS